MTSVPKPGPPKVSQSQRLGGIPVRPAPYPQEADALLESTQLPQWTISRTAEFAMQRNGLTKEQVLDAVNSPTQIRVPNEPGRDTIHADGLLIVVPNEAPGVNPQIIHVAIAQVDDDAQAPQVYNNQPSRSNRRAKSGGRGRRMPTNGRELAQAARDHGFEIERRGNKHLALTHPEIPADQHGGANRPIFAPTTPSDSRALKNCVATIRRYTGIDITATD